MVAHQQSRIGRELDDIGLAYMAVWRSQRVCCNTCQQLIVPSPKWTAVRAPKILSLICSMHFNGTSMGAGMCSQMVVNHLLLRVLQLACAHSFSLVAPK